MKRYRQLHSPRLEAKWPPVFRYSLNDQGTDFRTELAEPVRLRFQILRAAYLIQYLAQSSFILFTVTVRQLSPPGRPAALQR